MAARPKATAQVRVIGGRWRHRRLRFPDANGLRPTPDRVRETLFNWLQPWLEGARCLDLFAGSGALSFEALSRGADGAVAVEADARAVAGLRANREALQATGLTIQHDQAEHYLVSTAASPFDIVFIDPPFASGGYGRLCALLEQNGWLGHTALVYLEARRGGIATADIPAGWAPWRSQRAGRVEFALLRRDRTV